MTSEDPHAKDVREICEFKILWEGNPINLTKTFGTRNCSLCLQEKLQIVRRSRKSTGGEFLNRRSEIEGTCRHKTNFHRLRVREDTTVATDERTCLVVPTETLIHKKVSEAKESMERCSVQAHALRARMHSKRINYYLCYFFFRFIAYF